MLCVFYLRIILKKKIILYPQAMKVFCDFLHIYKQNLLPLEL
jgi:hypothetical protein